MGYRVVTYTYLDCPRCGVRIGSGDTGSPFNIGMPFKRCQACGHEATVPSNVGARDDEWEMKDPWRRDLILDGLLKEQPTDLSAGLMFGGCLGFIAVVVVFAVAIYFGARAVFENQSLVRGAIGAGLAVAIGFAVGWPFIEGWSNRSAQAKGIEALLGCVDSSRKRMGDPTYRVKLRSLGQPARAPDDQAEPPFVEADVGRLRARLEELRRPRA